MFDGPDGLQYQFFVDLLRRTARQSILDTEAWKEAPMNASYDRTRRGYQADLEVDFANPKLRQV